MTVCLVKSILLGGGRGKGEVGNKKESSQSVKGAGGKKSVGKQL